MKPTQSTVIHVLLGIGVVTASVLSYALLAPPGHQGLSRLMWIVFGGASLILLLAAFLPSLLRRRAGLPAMETLPPADIRFYSLVLLAGLMLAGIGMACGATWMGPMAILAVPLAFLFRRPRIQ